MQVPLLAVPVKRWECQHCSFRDTTRQAGPHTRFHPCSGLGGLSTPMVEEGTVCRVVQVDREDYVGSEDVQLTDTGRAVMAVRTEYPDGRSDCAVYAPTAHLRLSA